MSRWIYGLNAVKEALEAGRCRVRRVMVSAGRHDARIAGVLRAARRAGVVVQHEKAGVLARAAGAGARHQGVVALADSPGYTSVEEMLAAAAGAPLLVVLDGVEDPRNLGAVIRSAAAAGCAGLILPERRTPGLTGACLKAAAGGADRLPIARVPNIVSNLKLLKERGLWVVGLDSAGDSPWTSFDFTLPVALVLGGEGRGLRRLARETCDAVVSIPLSAGVESLNLSVAAGIALFEAVRQRSAGSGKIF